MGLRKRGVFIVLICFLLVLPFTFAVSPSLYEDFEDTTYINGFSIGSMTRATGTSSAGTYSLYMNTHDEYSYILVNKSESFINLTFDFLSQGTSTNILGMQFRLYSDSSCSLNEELKFAKEHYTTNFLTDGSTTWSSYPTNTWKEWSFIFDNRTGNQSAIMYIDGVQRGSSTRTKDIACIYFKRVSVRSSYHGFIDELNLDYGEETEIINISNYLFSAKDRFTNSSLNNFNVTIGSYNKEIITGELNINNTHDWVNTIPLEINGVSYSTSGSYFDFDGISDYLLLDSSSSPSLNNYSFVFKIQTDTTGKQQIYDHKYNYINDEGFTLKLQTSNNIQLCNSKDCFVTTTTLNTGQTYCIGATYDGVTGKIYINGALDSSSTLPQKTENSANEVRIGSSSGSSNFFNGRIYSAKIYDQPKTLAEIQEACDESSTDDEYIFNTDNLVYFNPFGLNSEINISINSQDYYTNNSLNYVLNGTDIFYLTPYYYFNNYSVSDYITNGTDNFTREVTFDFSLICSDSYDSSIVQTIGTETIEYPLTCSNETFTSKQITYTHNSEGEYTTTFMLNISYPTDLDDYEIISNQNFISDLENPTISYLNITLNGGFLEPVVNATMICTDNIMNNFTFNLTANSEDLGTENHSNGTTYIKEFNATHGDNTIKGTCFDGFGTTSNTTTTPVYTRQIFLINEIDNTFFNDFDNVTSLKVYFDDESSSFDFKSSSVYMKNFSSLTINKLRFEIGYSDGTIVTRYVDTALNDENDLRVCVNSDDRIHYEQLVLSASQKPVTVKNVYSDCVIAEDYTRFAYQDAYILKAYTTNGMYFLYTIDQETTAKTYLASMDGSLATYYNLDILEFNSQSTNLAITGSSLTFERNSEGEYITIYFERLDGSSIETILTITEMNSSEVFLTFTEEDTPNKLSVTFDYSTLNLTGTELFKIEVTTKNSDFETETISRYFNTSGSSGTLPSPIAFVTGVLLTIFGLTFTISRLSMGWFGFVVVLSSIAIMSFAVSTWYITLFMAIDLIILVFIAIILWSQNSSTMVT